MNENNMIPGLAERRGREVIDSPDGRERDLRDRPLAVLGGSPGAVGLALRLRELSRDVAFFAHLQDLSPVDRARLAEAGVRLAEGVVSRFVIVDDRLAGLETERGCVVAPAAIVVEGPGPFSAEQERRVAHANRLRSDMTGELSGVRFR